jgi:microcystin-dependent protein
MFATPGTRQKAGAAFPSGTLMLFQQSTAPLGWTKRTTHNDKALRVVSGAASFGGTNAFSTVMAQTVVGSTTLSTAQMPSHTHGYTGASAVSQSGLCGSGLASSSSLTTASQGGGGSHNHTVTMAIQYVDLIIARKN